MNYKLRIYCFLLTTISVSCLKDNIVPIENIELNDTAVIMRYIESTGDFANTDLAPGLVSAEELFSNKTEYLILDIRTPLEYSSGHIDSAINIKPIDLYDLVDSLNLVNPSHKIVIISQNGQSSAYYVCLLRLTGFTNVYTLNYGMASWNMFFADEWISALDNVDQLFTNTEYPKREFTNLPKLEFPSSLKTGREKTIYRIKEIISKGFVEGTNYYKKFSTNVELNNYLVCYGPVRLYNEFAIGGKGHPENTVWFKDVSLFEFRSVYSLQTLPNDEKILIYSADGQLSACIVAYLTVLGYDVKTLFFGAHQLFYSRLNSEPALTEYVFSIQDIMNYPYVTGK